MKLLAEIEKIQGKKDLSDREFAESLRVDPSQISLFKSGKQPPGIKLLIKIVRTYPKLRKYVWRYIEKEAILAG